MWYKIRTWVASYRDVECRPVVVAPGPTWLHTPTLIFSMRITPPRSGRRTRFSTPVARPCHTESKTCVQ